MHRKRDFFTRLASRAAHAVGHPLAFGIAAAIVVAWAASGPSFGFSDTWQLVINTGTTIVTFLMVFLIQNTQNRDSAAIHLKLDELIRAMKGAHVALLDLEELSDRELARFRERYEKLAEEAREQMRAGGSDTGSPDVDHDAARLERRAAADAEAARSAGNGRTARKSRRR
jgi:low affinity Fe/Cu permease